MKSYTLAFLLSILAVPAIAAQDYIEYCGDHINTKVLHPAATYTLTLFTGTLLRNSQYHSKDWWIPSAIPGLLAGTIKEIGDLANGAPLHYSLADLVFWDGAGIVLGWLTIDVLFPAGDVTVAPADNGAELTWRF